ncbi:MAG: methionine adenosyltransferase [Nitrospirota bacterium]|nr:methionine adenosyltransferase [Nitrospirota bacterium]
MSRNPGEGDFLFTSESVTEGHPDKICDQISDAVLDAMLAGDPMSRVAVETTVTTGLAMLCGEVTTNTYVEIQDLVREVIKDIGYTHASYGYDYETCAVLSAIHSQSPDIAMGVDTGGAGDQGLMFGYATNESPNYMPVPISLAHQLSAKVAEVRKKDVLHYLRPDAKTQVSVRYENYKPVQVEAIVVSTQHGPDITLREIREDIIEKVITPVIPANMVDFDSVAIHVNPTGRFVVGGPHGDAGLTGRKIIVDTYGGMGRHGGGAFSGKDPTKVDRSACYFMRYIAKNLVAAGLAERCEVQVAYAIGVAEPVSVYVHDFDTGTIPHTEMEKLVRKHFDLTPKGIIETLDLRRPIYRKTSNYGHFGREEPEFTWERTDMADALKKDAGKLGA